MSWCAFSKNGCGLGGRLFQGREHLSENCMGLAINANNFTFSQIAQSIFLIVSNWIQIYFIMMRLLIDQFKVRKKNGVADFNYFLL